MTSKTGSSMLWQRFMNIFINALYLYVKTLKERLRSFIILATVFFIPLLHTYSNFHYNNLATFLKLIELPYIARIFQNTHFIFWFFMIFFVSYPKFVSVFENSCRPVSLRDF